MKQALTLLLLTFCFHATAQRQVWSEINKYNYSGRKIKTGESLVSTDGDSMLVLKMHWEEINGESVVVASVKKAQDTSEINLTHWLKTGESISPAAFIKINSESNLTTASLRDSIITGYELNKGLLLAGSELVKFHNQFQLGNTLLLIGATASLAGTAFLLADNASATSTTGINGAGPWIAAAGAGIGVVGWIINATSSKHVKNAGLIMQGIIPLNTGRKKVQYL